jgi:predicted anti-sigma-YlaC factor YlaD
MQCAPFREAISARLDGEPSGVPAAALDAHLAACPGCTAWADDAALVTRRARLAPAPPVPDLTAAVLAALPAIQRQSAANEVTLAAVPCLFYPDAAAAAQFAMAFAPGTSSVTGT